MRRIPITAITVFGVSSLLAISIGIVLFLGFSQAAKSTRQLLANQAGTLIDAMELSIDSRLKPVRDQARWIADNIHDVSDPASLDASIFGSLAATPQVAGVAIVLPNGRSRQWHRQQHITIEEDWSNRAEIMTWLEVVKNEGAEAWRAPIWVKKPVHTTTLLHDIPLYDLDGKFIGVFAQIVPIYELSASISKRYTETGITPFVLYDKKHVLAHPSIAGNALLGGPKMLYTLDTIGDLVLGQIWTPDDETPFISDALDDIEASGIFWGDNYYLYLYRNVDRFGPVPWTIGAYINTKLISDDETKRLLEALLVSLVVMSIAVIASVIIGRKISKPVRDFVLATNTIESGGLDAVPVLESNQIREFDDASRAFNSMVHGLRERELLRDTLGRFVPEEVAGSLLAGGGSIEVQQTEATILFCDIESFTQLTETLGAIKIVELLNEFFSSMVDILEKHHGIVTQFQGDAILATFNVPVGDDKHAHNAILAAQEMLDCVTHNAFNLQKLGIRVGINTGTVVAGAIGAKGRQSYTVHGDAVNLAARLENLNKEYNTRILISESTASLVEDIELTAVGKVTVRGQSRSISLYTLKLNSG